MGDRVSIARGEEGTRALSGHTVAGPVSEETSCSGMLPGTWSLLSPAVLNLWAEIPFSGQTTLSQGSPKTALIIRYLHDES